jgi:hypothetical protein
MLIHAGVAANSRFASGEVSLDIFTVSNQVQVVVKIDDSQVIEIIGCSMADHFQLTTIIATAIRECRLEVLHQRATPQEQDSNNMEEAHCIAKAVLAAITDAGFEISPKQANAN